MPVQTLDISPVGRVEGDLDVRVDIENGVVTNAWTQAELFRGFEIILRDKDPQAGLVVTPRACGICGASHLTCAHGRSTPLGRRRCRATPSWRATSVRSPRACRVSRVTSTGCTPIDMTNKKYRGSKFYEEAVKRFAPFTGTLL